MKKIYLFISVCFILLYSNTYAVMKFDLGLSGGIGGLWGLSDPSPNPEVNNLTLNARLVSVGLNLEVINVMSWSKPYYGMGFGLYVGAAFYEQWFGNMTMTNGQSNGFGSYPTAGTDKTGGNSDLMQMLSIMVLDIAPMYRFYPTRELSIGIGPVISLMLNKGNAKFLESAKYAEYTNLSAYLSPMVADTVALSLMIDTTITKFWGNFGLYFGVNIRVPFSPLGVGVEGKGGVKYRFNT